MKASCYILVKTCVMFFIAASAFAHEAGHGPAVSGQGPRGGKLSAVIKASDAEKGQEAPVVALVEYEIEGKELVLKFWETDQKTDAKLTGPSKIKWIALPFDKTKGKAMVSERAVGKPSTEVRALITDIAPKGARAVEVILPAFLNANDKHVAFLHIELKK